MTKLVTFLGGFLESAIKSFAVTGEGRAKVAKNKHSQKHYGRLYKVDVKRESLA